LLIFQFCDNLVKLTILTFLLLLTLLISFFHLVEDETKLLYEEATMSIEELLAKYGRVSKCSDKSYAVEN